MRSMVVELRPLRPMILGIVPDLVVSSSVDCCNHVHILKQNVFAYIYCIDRSIKRRQNYFLSCSCHLCKWVANSALIRAELLRSAASRVAEPFPSREVALQR